MLNALADERMPRRAILALYARARPPKELICSPDPTSSRTAGRWWSGLIDQVLGRIVAR